MFMDIEQTSNAERPFIQVDDLVREMTDEEYADLLASGWTPEPEVLQETPETPQESTQG